MKSKRELLFLIENYTGHNVDIKEMSHPKKHARTYINRFSITEDDQYEISKVVEINSDWEYRACPDDTFDRFGDLVRSISAESLDIFLFGWYRSHGTTTFAAKHLQNEHKRSKIRIHICDTLEKERFRRNRIVSILAI